MNLHSCHENEHLQIFLGLSIGIGFGFLLQKGGVTNYDVIIGQLLLTDFTVLKLMLTAVIVGMPGIHLMRQAGWIEFHTFRGSAGSSIVGGLIFGVGFGLLGYCPGTVAGAIGQGQIDALLGGVAGILIGCALFAAWYPSIKKTFLEKGMFPAETIPESIGLPPWVVVFVFMVLMSGFLVFLEWSGL